MNDVVFDSLSFMGFIIDITVNLCNRGIDHAGNTILFPYNTRFHCSEIIFKFLHILPVSEDISRHCLHLSRCGHNRKKTYSELCIEFRQWC